MRQPERFWGAVIALQVMVVLMLAVALALATSYPTAASRISTKVLAGRPGVIAAAAKGRAASSSVIDRAAEGFEYRIHRPWLELTSGEDPGGQAEAPTPGTTFPAASCEECHEGYEKRPLHATVYFPHAAHTAENDCDSCHHAEGSNRDASPPMTRCASCHPETTGSTQDCLFCHPPGALFHGDRSAADAEIGRKCGVCHNEAKLASRARSHEMPQSPGTADDCSSCHGDSFCGRCHPAAHGDGYVILHPAEFRARTAVHQKCWTCHDAAWCAMQCHAVPDESR